MAKQVKLPETMPCPCCGGEGWAHKLGSWGLVRCVRPIEGKMAHGCGLRLETSQGIEEAIRLWNSRQGSQTAVMGTEKQ